MHAHKYNRRTRRDKRDKEGAMDRLNQLSDYYKEKEKRRLQSLRAESGGLPEMSLAELKLSCLENDGYDSPELNGISQEYPPCK
jgi:hypothetical protein